MTTTHNLGFPRIGHHRELKFAQEAFWSGDKTERHLQQTGQAIRSVNWQHQSGLDWSPVGDFSFYDQVLDMSMTLGNVPQRFSHLESDAIETYFHIARGQGVANGAQSINNGNFAGEMTKWFNTNYHYIVPEFHKNTDFTLDASRLLAQLTEAKQQNIKAKPVIIGPVTYLALGKEKDDSNKLDLLSRLLPVYEQLLNQLAEAGAEWVQIDEPVLATELDAEWRHAFELAYHRLSTSRPKLMLAVYFGSLENNFKMASKLPVAGFHIDAISAPQEVTRWVDCLPSEAVLSVGAINGRNIWKTDLNRTLNWLEPIKERLQEHLWLAPSCSLLHVPVDLNTEIEGDEKGSDVAANKNKTAISAELKNWLAFAVQKLDELTVLASALENGRETVAKDLADNQTAIQERQQSPKTHNQSVRDLIDEQKSALTTLEQRQSPFEERAEIQSAALNLPLYPTTTIGSFPQTKEIRQTRRQFKRQEISVEDYTQKMKAEIARCVTEQEALGLDVLVHGEAERNDMVEYFGEQLDGYAFSRYGWVQSYGSRCVKPPILFGDIQRPNDMTVEWAKYAQSLTEKPMKGMLTGPVTILNWSFVRDDQPRSDTCLQLAFAIREEVLALEQAGINVIQIDEAALREGLPLRESEWQSYLDWAVQAFRVTANGVKDSTQIHTHMCYSEFNDIIESIASMDADVVTIETSRSDMELLEVFKDFDYPNDIGPGVYDIHSPNIPNVDQIVNLMHKAAKHIPSSRLWVNPDCGLKTRHWKEVIPSLQNMIHAVYILRAEASEKAQGEAV